MCAGPAPQQLQQERQPNFFANAAEPVIGSNHYRNDPRIRVNLDRHSLQSSARTRTVDTKTVVEPE
jgi:hypothetical protein